MPTVDECSECIHCRYHPPGSIHAVAECGDDPYPYHYCRRNHWPDSVAPYTPWPDDGEHCGDYCPPQED